MNPLKAGFPLCLLLAPIFALAAQPLQPMDEFDIESAVDPQISPDGSRVAYVRNFADVMSDQRFSSLWMVDVDGTNHRPILSGKHHAGDPRWSPDGTRLAFVSDHEGSPQIYIRWMDTGDTAAITSETLPPSNISWSPDGQSLAFTRLVPDAPLVIGQMPAAPPGAEWAEPPKYTDQVAFRFDQVGEIPRGYMHFFVVSADGGKARQISSGPRQFGVGSYVWAPEGKSLVFSANLDEGTEMFHAQDTEVWEIAISDGRYSQLTDRSGPDDSPSVSPDGKRISYLGFDDQFQGHQQTELYVANRDGSNSRVISDHIDRQIQGQRGGGSPHWAPDGKGVYAVIHDEGDAKLVLFSFNGSHRVVAEDVGSGSMAYVGFNSLWSVSDGGTVAFAHNAPHIAGDVGIVENGGTARVITALNADLFANRELGEVEEIWWESSKDGRPVQGWIIKPPGFDPEEKYPLILEIHGGPFAAYGDHFDIEKQQMAAAGNVVLYANPRGSTSYGEAFSNLIHHAYPGDDFFDLDSGVDAVIARGYIDEDHLFVTGGSGGGVLTAWMVGRSKRFRAAVSFYPVINWESFIFSADMAAYFADYWVPGLPWEHRENYESRSLLKVTQTTETPVLIMTGEEDWRTPMSESEQYYKALKLQGVESVLVRVPGEPHGIRRRPSHAISKMTTTLGWFDKYSERE
jgi:acylaminoacyl-peptidase